MTNNHPGFFRGGFTKKGVEGMHTSSKTKKELKSFLFVLPHLILFFVFGFLGFEIVFWFVFHLCRTLIINFGLFTCIHRRSPLARVN